MKSNFTRPLNHLRWRFPFPDLAALKTFAAHPHRGATSTSDDRRKGACSSAVQNIAYWPNPAAPVADSGGRYWVKTSHGSQWSARRFMT